jgi:hypothetical protein
MSRPRSRSVHTLIRTSQRCRTEQACFERAYELALPVVRRRLADATSTKACPILESLAVPQRRYGGS